MSEPRALHLSLTRTLDRKRWEFVWRSITTQVAFPALDPLTLERLPSFRTRAEAINWGFDAHLPAFCVWNGKARRFQGFAHEQRFHSP